ncbi:MAG: hypothetical protein WBQ50_03225 [Nocardioides sp.]
MRGLAAFLVLLVAGLMVPAATAGWWLRDTVVPRSAYVETVAPLADDPDVQDAVAATLVKRTRASLGGVPAPIADRVEALVARATRVVVEGPAFARAWEESNRAAHRQIVGALTGDSESVGVDSGSTVELRLGPLSAAVREEVDKAGIPFSGAIPRAESTYPLGSTDDLGRAQIAFRLLKDYGRALPAIAVILLVVGLGLARRFGPALVGTALLGLIGLGGLWLALGAGRSSYLDSLPAAVPEAAGRAYYDVLTAGLYDLMGYVTIGCAAAVLIGIIGSVAGGRRA